MSSESASSAKYTFVELNDPDSTNDSFLDESALGLARESKKKLISSSDHHFCEECGRRRQAGRFRGHWPWVLATLLLGLILLITVWKTALVRPEASSYEHGFVTDLGG